MLSMEGALIIDKPADFTSHDVVARVRKIIGERRVGHTGTLDPFATGVLVILVGRATRLAQFLSDSEKEYEALIRFGYRTDTGDVTGSRIEAASTTEALRSTEIHGEEIEDALAKFRGEIEQTPPMYSAKKIGGRKLYELARRGEEVERKPVRVRISEFECMSREGELVKSSDDGTNDLTVRVVCSAGTYIRTLAEDLGKQLGTGAHLAELRRTRAGKFKIEDAITLEQLEAALESGSITKQLIAPHDALAHLPSVALSEVDLRRILNGIDLVVEDDAVDWAHFQPIRLTKSSGELLAVGLYDQDKRLIHPKVVLNTERG
jgi:tRNA pseudouridine55 synthase